MAWSWAEGIRLIETNFSTKIKVYRYFTLISNRTTPARGQVAVKGAEMTIARRIRMKKTRGSNLSLLAGLVLVVLALACCGQNNNNNLKADKKPIDSKSNSGDPAANSRHQAQNSQFVPDEVLVKFDPDTQPETIERIQAELQLETVRKFRSPNLFLMKITDGTAVEAIIQKLKAYPAVKYAEPNYVVKANP
jgi:hypothetical protein